MQHHRQATDDAVQPDQGSGVVCLVNTIRAELSAGARSKERVDGGLRALVPPHLRLIRHRAGDAPWPPSDLAKSSTLDYERHYRQGAYAP